MSGEYFNYRMEKEIKMRTISASICALFIALILVFWFTLWSLINCEKQLDDCRFECNHLQTRIAMLEELNDYVPAME
ncbi:MAG: hypothetical protein U9Q18_01520 [Caldisericota bacterium]|nr:hypothetical protein [Caldisericota bacterium]